MRSRVLMTVADDTLAPEHPAQMVAGLQKMTGIIEDPVGGISEDGKSVTFQWFFAGPLGSASAGWLPLLMYCWAVIDRDLDIDAIVGVHFDREDS